MLIKKITLIIVSVFFISVLFSQENKTLIKVEYNEFVVYSSDIINKYKGKLYANDNFVGYKTEFVETKTIEIETPQKYDKYYDTETIDISIEDSQEENHFSEIAINRKNKTLVESLYESETLENYYSVHEDQPKMNWELLGEEKQINNYNCKKAKTTFRGRSYQVWYTPEIPISVGPWKFGGLPGLILSVKDIEGIYNWEVSTVVYPYTETENNLSFFFDEKSKFIKITYRDFDKKRIDGEKEKSKELKAKSKLRGYGIVVSFSTNQWKEPINEWRTQTNFDF